MIKTLKIKMKNWSGYKLIRDARMLFILEKYYYE